MARPKYLSYKVSGKLIKLLGRHSVSTANAAIFELVKNAYDADAKKVTIYFENIELAQETIKALNQRYTKISTELKIKFPNKSLNEIDQMTKSSEEYVRQEEYVKKRQKETRIVIIDDGNGMTLDRLRNKWMVVGVDKDVDELTTKKGRIVVGEKGVGRFAVEKLSKQLKLISSPVGTTTQITAEFDWEKFDGNKILTNQKIPVTYAHKEKDKKGLHLELIDLNDTWTRRRINELINEISILVPPKNISSKHPFSIFVKIDGVNEPIEVESALFNQAPYYFQAELTADSNIKFVEARFKKDLIIPNKSKHDLFGMREMFQFEKDGERVLASCGPAKLTFYGFPMDPPGRDLGWDKFYGKINKEEFENSVKEASGVKIYRDGFRVRPYGDTEHDWLQLVSTARRIHGRLPNNRIVGWVEITSKDNPDIIDTTTREKIIESKAFEDLREFVNSAIDEYSKYTESKRQDAIRLETLAEVPKLIKKLGEKISVDDSLPEQIKKEYIDTINSIQMEVTKGDERSIIEKESLMDEKNAYRNLSSLGIATGVVSHESNIYLRDIISHSALLKREASSSSIKIEKILEHLKYIEPSAKNLLSYMMLVKGFTASMGSRDKSFRKKQTMNLKSEVSRIFKGLHGFFEVWDIHPEIKISNNFPKLRMFRADLQSLILNLTSNSMKSLKHYTAERASLSKSKKNKIRITAHTDAENTYILFSDNGLGIPLSDRDIVFKLFWTRTARRETSESGSGLGLPIVKQIVADYGGTIEIKNASEFEQGVTFKITIPKMRITG